MWCINANERAAKRVGVQIHEALSMAGKDTQMHKWMERRAEEESKLIVQSVEGVKDVKHVMDWLRLRDIDPLF